MKKMASLFLGCLLAANFLRGQDTLPANPLFDDQLTPNQRIDWLLSVLTPEEKMAQMVHNAPAIPRLNIPAYNWWNECLHGVGRAGFATVFPMPIGMAASFDSLLLHQVATAISDEARAKYHEAIRKNNHSAYQGLTFWSPNINLFRDPRWGRGMETYGEDPYLTGTLATAFIKGLQGDDTTCLKLIATAKHLAVHSGPEAIRHSFNAQVSDFDLYNSYLPHFKMTIDEADVQSVMCAYNRLLDEPCCGSNPLLADILRNKWGFKGYVVSDCWAISDFYQFHKITPDAISSASKALKAGTDLNCGSSYRSLPDAFKNDMISLDEIDTSLRRLFWARIKLGMFDKPEKNPFASLAMSRVDTLPHQQLALEMAHESIVLLKNEASLLPLSKDISAIAVIGPNADAPESLLGNYHGSPGRLITPLQGIREKLGSNTSIYFVPGIPFADSLPQFCLPPVDFEENPFLMGESWMEQAMEAVRLSDVVILCMGLSPSLEGEALQVKITGFSGGDRVTLMLPAIQQELIKRVVQQAKPVVLLLMSGSAVSIPWEKEHIPAILQAWYPGQAGGTAIADVLFGDYNPGGKLPVTLYASDESLPDFTDYSMKNRTYRFINSEPLFEFGYGLSYTSFSLEDIEIDKTTLHEEESAFLSAKLTNTGLMAGDEVLQLYIDFPDDEYQGEGYINHPWLRGYQRIHLNPGESASVQFIINRKTLNRLNESGEYLLNGTYRIYLSNSSKINTPGIELKLE